ncbi:hypothetical protein GCM10022243_54190 [Saccharothrix violaceirubra]|uniref:DUF4389 domain-containing protein n=1 Tax=Saccharothrix violaceirubra TaxID=413306 RepID=A0A7W7WXA9_9PSEU|nr:DUF4389 domain-containing protein [Saccharothrix violaceirubra]MBB4966931.1 hypothetical protein [Saccharothrix violaceirubra]
MTTYPVRVHGRFDPALNRWLWLVKWLPAIPHYVVLAVLWTAFGVVGLCAFVSILVTGRYPRPLFDFALGVLRWTWRVAYYSFGALATDRYPPFSLGEEPDYPATLDVAYPERLSRGLVLVKWLLAIPHLVVVTIFLGGGGYLAFRAGEWAFSPAGGLVGLLVLIAGVVLLFTGRYPRGVFDFVLGMDRWALRVAAYVGLMTDAYPPFRFDPGGDEPGAAALDAPPPPASSSGPPSRVVPAVIGVLLLLLGTGSASAGALGLWAEQARRDATGAVAAPALTVHTSGYAVELGTAELRWTEAGQAVGEDWLGTVGLRVDPGTFVGIGPAADVTRYLAGVERDRVTGFGDRTAYRHSTGVAPTTPPHAQPFWAATGVGSLTWTPRPGDWTAVVMNADGSRVVDTPVVATATLPALAPLSWTAFGGGVLLLLLGGGLVLFAATRPTRPAAPVRTTIGDEDHA